MVEGIKEIRSGRVKTIHAAIGFLIMIAFSFIPAPAPLTQVGMQIIGIFIGTLYLWSTVDILWSSIFCVVMIGMSEYDSMPHVLQLAFGNVVAVQCLFIFIFVGAMVNEGITDHIGRWFLTRKISEGKPWVFTLMICLGCFVISAFVNPFTPIILFWPVVYGIFKQIGYTAKDKYPKLLVILIVLSSLAGFPVPPYMSNGLALLSNFRNISDNQYTIVDGMYFISTMVLGLLFIVMSILICKYVFRPDIGNLKNVSIEKINEHPLTPLDTRQKVLGWMFVLFSLVMLLPSWFPTLPVLDFLHVNSIGVATLFVGVLAGIFIKGKPIMQMGPAIQKGVPWGTEFLIIAALLIGTVLTNEKTGLSAFLSANLGPIFSGMDLIVFAIVLLIVLMLLSNVCNSLVVGMILQPIILLYCQTNGVEAAALVTISTFFVLSCAMFTPSASPFAAMLFSNREWLAPTDIYKYTGVFILAELLLCIAIGYPLTMVLM